MLSQFFFFLNSVLNLSLVSAPAVSAPTSHPLRFLMFWSWSLGEGEEIRISGKFSDHGISQKTILCVLWSLHMAKLTILNV